MELSDSDRPVSFGSTSSSASSRDSHCSFGSRMTLASNSHLGLFHQDKEVGAIKLELVPARQLSNDDLPRNFSREQSHGSPREKTADERQNVPWKAESKGTVKNCSRSEVMEPGSPKLMYVDRVVQEILQTERTYVQDLKSIVEDYLNCICDQTRLTLGMDERSALFGNIRDIYHFNSELLQELENCYNDPVAIAECFVSKSEEFHIYTQYCTNYPRSVAILTECMRNKILAKFFRERQEVLHHSLPLGSYLLKPVQRILKYHLLLHEISNHLDKDTEGYDVVLDAIDTMQRVAWHINDMKRKHEHEIRLQEIQSLLTNWKGLDLTSYGELVLEGTFRIQRAKNERTLFLFDRLLLITKKREDTYTYKAHILCCNLMLVEVIAKEPLSFSVFHYKNPKLQHTVQAKSQQDKRLWILHLKRLILENHPAKIPAKAKQAILEMDAIHHPGFCFTPEGEKKAAVNEKDGLVSGRVRRKSEPSSNLHKVMKQNDTSPVIQKRISIQDTLLCQAAKLGSGDMDLSPVLRKAGVLDHSNHVSQEYLAQAYNRENRRLGATDQTDADDEEDSEHSSQQKIKGGRKRLNSQASENVEKRRSINLSLCDSQNLKDPSDDESSHLNADPLFPGSVVRPSSRQQSTPHSNSLIMNILGGTNALRNIWTDHQIRQALFPPRRSPQELEEDDDYQMFMMSDSSKLDSSRAQEERSPSSRPCSWHLGSVQGDLIPNSYCRIVRRASSVGENKTSSNKWRGHHNYYRQTSREEDVETSSSHGPHNSSLGSAEELTIDDIEHVYDNISYEDLKQMGLARRDESDFLNAAANGLHQSNDNIRICPLKGCGERTKSSVVTSRNTNAFKRGSSTSNSQELKVIEENIYDSIRLPEQSLASLRRNSYSKRSNFLGLDSDFQCFDHLDGFVSEESLQFSEDESLDHQVPVREAECFNLLDVSSNSDSLSHKSAADKLSEEVDEIWNDLENYIKKNEEKKSEHLLASFPVSKDDVHQTRNKPHLRKDVEYSLSSLCLPDKSPAVRKNINNPKVIKDEVSSQHYKRGSSLDLKRTSLASEMSFVDPTYFASSSTLSYSDAVSTDKGLDIIDKSKNKVFMMARQYSHKIKKANPLLKMKSPEQEQLSLKQQKLKTKDMPDMMEEKKQGGTAIGARIAEYSQLYDQIIFRDSPTRTPKETKCNPNESPLSRSKFEQPKSPGTPIHTRNDSIFHSTNINGDVGDFYTWPDHKDLKSRSGLFEHSTKSSQRHIAHAGSVPSLTKDIASPSLAQRWSTVSQQFSEHVYENHSYNSLGRRIVCEKAQPYIRSQSSSSMLIHGIEGSLRPIKSVSAKQPLSFLKPERQDELYNVGEHSRNERTPQTRQELSNMTLQDTQKILVLNTLTSLNAQIATLNYYANFKDGDGDDDDYVEIKSEDEDENLETASNQRVPSVLKGKSELQQTSASYNFNKPIKPVKTFISKETSEASQVAYEDADKLNDYLWREPPSNQQNIVQSLREKFQCLSSSSFA
ncbi:pleckstrin homology domain-containing family G member 1 [Bombina bombina]|uniref:pleckstrin homology domain-containing family G member 1 n=1 Tax=Bombina bombina TaxID=8345 RepID=UPI00235A7E46|nr:pleckstrin homology domain-containing family G member 1 [Bombina bombina]